MLSVGQNVKVGKMQLVNLQRSIRLISIHCMVGLKMLIKSKNLSVRKQNNSQKNNNVPYLTKSSNLEHTIRPGWYSVASHATHINLTVHVSMLSTTMSPFVNSVIHCLYRSIIHLKTMTPSGMLLQTDVLWLLVCTNTLHGTNTMPWRVHQRLKWKT